MKRALKQLLNSLDKVAEQHDEVFDTDVREAMFTAVWKGFIAPESRFTLPEEYAMFSPEGNQAVKQVLATFLAHPEVIEASKLLQSRNDRLRAFQDGDIESSAGMYFDDFFGYCDEDPECES